MNYQVYTLKKVVARSKMQRVTVDSKQCLRFWYNQGKIVTGCTTAITPDGSENGKEWC